MASQLITQVFVFSSSRIRARKYLPIYRFKRPLIPAPF